MNHTGKQQHDFRKISCSMDSSKTIFKKTRLLLLFTDDKKKVLHISYIHIPQVRGRGDFILLDFRRTFSVRIADHSMS